MSYACYELYSEGSELFNPVGTIINELIKQFGLSDLCVREKIRRVIESVYDGLPLEEAQRRKWTKRKLLGKFIDLYYDVDNLEQYREDSVKVLLQNDIRRPDGTLKCENGLKAQVQKLVSGRIKIKIY